MINSCESSVLSLDFSLRRGVVQKQDSKRIALCSQNRISTLEGWTVRAAAGVIVSAEKVEILQLQGEYIIKVYLRGSEL